MERLNLDVASSSTPQEHQGGDSDEKGKLDGM